MSKIKGKIINTFFVFLIIPFVTFAATDNIDVNLTVQGCNFNLVCEPHLGEDTVSCPSDCPFIPPEPPDPEPEPPRQEENRNRSDMRSPISELFSEFLNPTKQYLEPQNVRARLDEKNVNLYWSNPIRTDFDFIRITKTDFFTNNPYDGVIVYEGNAQHVQDYLEEFNKDYFYNFFAKYKDGNFSNGVWLNVNATQTSIYEDIRVEIGDKDVKFVPENVIEQVFYTPHLTIYDISFLQMGKKLPWENRRMQAFSGIPIEVVMPKSDYFGPIKDIFLYVNYFDKNERFLRQEVFKFDYVYGSELYKTKIFDVNKGEIINVKVVVKDGDDEYIVAGIIDVEDFQVVEYQGKNKFYCCCILLLIIIIILLLLIIRKFVKNVENIG